MMFMKITGTHFTCRKIEYGCVCLGPKHEKMGWSHMVGKWPNSWCGFREIPGASFSQRGLFSHIYGPCRVASITGHMKLRSSLRAILHMLPGVCSIRWHHQLCAFTHCALGKEWFSDSVISYFGSLCSTWLSDRGPNWLAIIHFARGHLGNLI
jgi:hypothetical protein